jgi:hypothetical protein
MPLASGEQKIVFPDEKWQWAVRIDQEEIIFFGAISLKSNRY